MGVVSWSSLSLPSTWIIDHPIDFGMDWLSQYQAIISCFMKIISLHAPSGRDVIFVGSAMKLMRTYLMPFHWRILNKILKLTTILMRGQWLGPKWNNYNMRWIFSLMIMNMPLLRIMYYLMEAHYLFSGLNHKSRTGWTLETKGDQREQVGVEMLCTDFDFQLTSVFCTILGGPTPSIIYG
jgi:hypothetical protein